MHSSVKFKLFKVQIKQVKIYFELKSLNTSIETITTGENQGKFERRLAVEDNLIRTTKAQSTTPPQTTSTVTTRTTMTATAIPNTPTNRNKPFTLPPFRSAAMPKLHQGIKFLTPRDQVMTMLGEHIEDNYSNE